MEIFIYSSSVVIYNLMRLSDTDVQEHCMAVLEITAKIAQMSIQGTPDFERLRARLIEEHQQLPQGVLYRQIVQDDVKKIGKFLTVVTSVEKWPEFDINTSDGDAAYTQRNGGWQNVDAPFIWEWIHIVSVHLDLNAGIVEKTNFILFIKNTVGCVFCRGHYIGHIPKLIVALSKLSLTDIYLILHTTIALENTGEPVFDVSKLSYINEWQKQRFFRQYCAIRNQSSSH